MVGSSSIAPSRSLLTTDVWEWAEKAGAALLALGLPAAVVAWWKKRRARRARERELRDSVADVVCVLADTQKAELARQLDEYFTDAEYRDRQAVLRHRLLKTRNRLWKAMGFPESKDEQSREQIALLRRLRMTQRWKAEEVERRERS